MNSIEWPDIKFPPVNLHVVISAYEYYNKEYEDNVQTKQTDSQKRNNYRRVNDSSINLFNLCKSNIYKF